MENGGWRRACQSTPVLGTPCPRRAFLHRCNTPSTGSDADPLATAEKQVSVLKIAGHDGLQAEHEKGKRGLKTLPSSSQTLAYIRIARMAC